MIVKNSILLVCAAALALASCSSERISNFPSYKLKVVQGNELDAEAVASLHAGMTQDQVQLLLGTPLLRDPFHTNRWDYTFETSRNGVVKESRNLTCFFDNGKLVKIEGTALAYAAEQLKAKYGTAASEPAAQ